MFVRKAQESGGMRTKILRMLLELAGVQTASISADEFTQLMIVSPANDFII
jgi:hypothetical protein